MFTLEQIRAAHGKVRSGADFPAYIREIKELGVVSYETFVTDGHAVFYGAGRFQLTSPAKYDALAIAGTPNKEQFRADLQAHQQGQSDYPAFCRQCAELGVEKWVVSTVKMTCVYYDKAGRELLTEEIPPY